MQKIVEAIKNNPVRAYSVVVASLALVAFYVPSLPVALILAVVAPLFGEGVRALVTPNRKLD